MKARILIIFVISVTFSGCCGTGYNTQRGAVIGAGIGALAGQAIGHDTEATLIGTAVGTLLGAITGNAVDQREAGYRMSPVQPGRAYAGFENAPPGGWVKNGRKERKMSKKKHKKKAEQSRKKNKNTEKK